MFRQQSINDVVFPKPLSDMPQLVATSNYEDGCALRLRGSK